MLAFVLACVGLRLTMAVWTKHPQVFSTMIVADAVDVIDLYRQGLAPPLGETAVVASILKNPSLEQTTLDCKARPAFSQEPFR